MTKKHFRLIAQSIYLTLTPRCAVCNVGFVPLSGGVFGCATHGIREDKNKVARDRLVDVLCHGFATANSRFNPTRFREACERGI
jgi:hypothetical protein